MGMYNQLTNYNHVQVGICVILLANGWFRIYRTGFQRRISIVYDLATHRSSTSMWTWYPSLNFKKLRHAPAMKKYDNMMTKSQGHFLTFARIAAGVTKRPVRSSGET